MRLVAIAVALSGCADPPVDVRACNRTGHAVMRLQASELGPQDLADGECTDYVEQQHESYEYTYCLFWIGGELYQHWPIDYLGATPLGPGRWTYVVKHSGDLALRTCSAYAIEDTP